MATNLLGKRIQRIKRNIQGRIDGAWRSDPVIGWYAKNNVNNRAHSRATLLHTESLEDRVLLASDLAAGGAPGELIDDVPAQVLSLDAAADGQLTGLNLDGFGDDKAGLLAILSKKVDDLNPVEQQVIDLIRVSCDQENVTLVLVTHSEDVARQFDRVDRLEDINQVNVAPDGPRFGSRT